LSASAKDACGDRPFPGLVFKGLRQTKFGHVCRDAAVVALYLPHNPAMHGGVSMTNANYYKYPSSKAYSEETADNIEFINNTTYEPESYNFWMPGFYDKTVKHGKSC